MPAAFSCWWRTYVWLWTNVVEWRPKKRRNHANFSLWFSTFSWYEWKYDANCKAITISMYLFIFAYLIFALVMPSFEHFTWIREASNENEGIMNFPKVICMNQQHRQFSMPPNRYCFRVIRINQRHITNK